MQKNIMKTRIIVLTTALALFTIGVNAQTRMQGGSISFGVRGGVNFQNINGKDADGNKLNNNMETRFNIGINAEIPVAPDFYVQPGLLYSTKGAKRKDAILGQNIISTVHLSYLEIPLNFIYKPVLGNGHLILGFGPYVALALDGKVKFKGNGSNQNKDVKFQNKVEVSDASDVVYFKPVDAGANLQAGYEFRNKFSFQLNAQLGLAKINPQYEGSVNDNSSWKNTGFGISLGYRF
jgi:hypothetical protein